MDKNKEQKKQIKRKEKQQKKRQKKINNGLDLCLILLCFFLTLIAAVLDLFQKKKEA